MSAEPRSAPGLNGTVLAQRYRIVRTIERGGMGAVYEARDELVGRSVAVKILLPQLSHEQNHIERFRREAVATAGLAHANVVQVTDFHCVPGEPAFLVMELLQGATVARTVMDGGPLAPERVVAIGLQLCAALTAAHDAGLVHRDLKPGNVFLVPLGDRRELVKVLDFGIAQMKRSDAYARLTATGAILGTPAYMPPEQAKGEELDARADVYAAGAILYTCLTGRKPFSGADPAQLIRQILTERPIPLRQLCPNVGPRLATAIETAMEKDRTRRFGSARALSDALGQALKRDSLPPNSDRLSPPSQESRLPAATPLPFPSPPPQHATGGLHFSERPSARAPTPFPAPIASARVGTPYPPPNAPSARVGTPYPPPNAPSARAATPYPPPTAPAHAAAFPHTAAPGVGLSPARRSRRLPVVLLAGTVALILLFVLVAAGVGLFVASNGVPSELARAHVGNAPQPGQFFVTVVSAPGRDATAVDNRVAQLAEPFAQCLANAELPRGTELRYELWSWTPTANGVGRFASVSRLATTPSLPGAYDDCAATLLADGWPPSDNPIQPVILAAVFR